MQTYDPEIMPFDKVLSWRTSIQQSLATLYAKLDPEYKDVLPVMNALIQLAFSQKSCYAHLVACPEGGTVQRNETRHPKVDAETIYTKPMHRQVRSLCAKNPSVTLEHFLCGYYYLGTAQFVAADEQVQRIAAYFKQQGVVRGPGRPKLASTHIKETIKEGIKGRIKHHQAEIVRMSTMGKDLLAELAECGEDPQLLSAFCSKYNLR